MKKYLSFILVFSWSFALLAQDDEYDFVKSKGWKKFKLTVNLTTGESVDVKSKFNIDHCNRVMYLVGADGHPIYPQNTTSVVRKLKDGTEITGYPTDSLWLFQIFEGKISGYSTVPKTKLKHLEYLTKNQSDMVEFSIEKLNDMMIDNPAAWDVMQKHFSIKKRVKNVYSLAFLLGLSHYYVPGVLKNSDGQEYPVYGSLAIVGVGYGAWSNRRAKKKVLEAIEIYNKK